MAMVLLSTGNAVAQISETPAPQSQAADEAAGDAPADTDGSGSSGEIVVTASRVARGGFEAPTPTTVLGAEDFTKRAATNVADVLTSMPSFASGTSPQSTNHTSITSGANIVDLRGLGVTRTLVLVDGHRFVPSTVQGRIDLNAIPAALIERAEVVTGGASAAWGSDAIAGVVNLIFRKKMTGLEGDFQAGISNYGDQQRYRGSLAWGTNFAGGRGNFVVAGEYEDNHGIGPYSSRSVLRTSKWQVVANPTYKLGNGQPQSWLVDDVNVSTATLGGLITGSTTTDGKSSTILKGTQFLPGGVPASFQYGSLVGTQYMVGGSPIGDVTLNQMGTLQVPLKRYNAFARASYEFSDAFTLFAEAAYAHSYTKFYITLPADLGTLKINADNAFLPQSIKDVMAANNLASLNFGRIARDGLFHQPVNINALQRYLLGAEGTVFGGWKWDAYFQFGQNHYHEDVLDNRNNANFFRALDAVVNPANGQIVCRSSLTDPSNGCVPINMFGEGSLSSAALAYSAGTSWQDAMFKEQSAAINLSGTPFSLWAGDVSLAVGAEWRHDTVDQTVDPLSLTSGWLIHNPKPLSGEISVKEVYGEVVVPLLKDVPLVKSLELNGAVRYTDYSTSGGVTSWKIGATWAVNDMLRLRATRSRDIRAPALGELFASAITQTANVIDPVLGNIQYTTLAPQTGNANLTPEIGDTWTVGMVLQPFRGLSASVDYYNISLDDSIGLPNTNDILNGCYTDNVQAYCDLIHRGGGAMAGTDRIDQILRQYINQGMFKEVGVDFELNYVTRVDNWFGALDGTFSARFLATYLDKLEQIYNGVTTDSAGAVGGSGGMPHWRFNASLSYSQNPVDFFLEGRLIGGGVRSNLVDAAGVPTILRLDYTNNISPQFLLNATVNFTLKDLGDGRRVQLYGSVKNITNQIETGNPFAYIMSTTGAQGLYDIIGRTYAAGVRFKF